MESPTLTPSGGEFLSQLGKTWDLIQTKAKELDKSEKKQRKTEQELQQVKESCEKFKIKSSKLSLKSQSLKAPLVLSSENSRLKKEFYNKDEQIEELTNAVESKEKNLLKKKKEIDALAKDLQSKVHEMKSLSNTNAELEDAVLSMKKDFDKKCKQWQKFESDVQQEHSRSQNQLKELQIEKEELGRHLWHVMEELKACERRVVTMQENEGQMQETKKKLDQEIEELKKEIQTSKDREKGNRTSWKHWKRS